MKNFIICTLALTVAGIFCATPSAQPMATPALAKAAAPAAEPLANTSKDAVTFSYPIAADSVLHERVAHRASSRAFRLDVDAAQLTRGVTLTMDAHGAVVRVSPLAGTAATLHIDDLVVQAADGRRLAAGSALDQLVDSADLRAAGLDAPDGALGFRLAEHVGAGRIVLQSVARHAADDRYLISVLDRNSKTTLDLQADATSYLQGARMTAHASMAGAGAAAKMTQVTASVHAPDGTAFPAAIRADAAGGVKISASLPDAASTVAGLWELRLEGSTAAGLQRNVKTAFAVAQATAQLSGRVARSAAADQMHVAVAAGVKHAGRYEVRAVLYGTHSSGKRVPAMVGASADWLEAGPGTLTLAFANADLTAAGVTAPYEIRDLHLIDQSRLAVLDRHAGVLVLD